MVEAPDQLVFGVMLVAVILTYLAVVSRAKLIGVIAMTFCIALAIELVVDHPLAPTVGLVSIGFTGLGLWNGYYAFFGKD